MISGTQLEVAKDAAVYIEENINQNITVKDLAEKFHISTTHLQNAFKGVYGIPVFTYIRSCKMQMAASELEKTNATVLEIANNYGYDNASKFSSAFRSVMGKNPVEYRKFHKNIQIPTIYH